MPAATGIQGPKTQGLRIPNLNLQGSILKTYTWLQVSLAVSSLPCSLRPFSTQSKTLEDTQDSGTQCSISHLPPLSPSHCCPGVHEWEGARPPRGSLYPKTPMGSSPGGSTWMRSSQPLTHSEHSESHPKSWVLCWWVLPSLLGERGETSGSTTA